MLCVANLVWNQKKMLLRKKRDVKLSWMELNFVFDSGKSWNHEQKLNNHRMNNINLLFFNFKHYRLINYVDIIRLKNNKVKLNRSSFFKLKSIDYMHNINVHVVVLFIWCENEIILSVKLADF